MTIATVTSPELMLIGADAVERIADVMARLHVSRPLIVTDPFIATAPPYQRLSNALTAAGIPHDSYSDTVPDPTTTAVTAGVDLLARGAADGPYDCMIAIGGGSSMDTAKAMGILHAGGGRMRDHKVPASPDMPVMPLICIPTTAGTGSEATRVTVITDVETDEKMLIMGMAALPAAAIVDYTLTMAKPFRLTADTGVDSLTHAIEAYVSRKANPHTDMLALNAMRLIAAHIRTACFDPGNAPAREAMMLAAMQAGMAFSNASVCLVHGMSRPIGAFFHVPHGLSNAMLLPAVTAFSIAGAPGRYADCARATGWAEPNADDTTAGRTLIEGLVRLNDDLEVPTPAAYGIDRSRYDAVLDVMADQALASGSPANNPVVPAHEQIVGLYRSVWGE
ncbi:iron-containing alcohol dehydrogenase [Fodinicurvata sp. EGI_FJ10296]|uniref:iron-containing alcohol dehydrogenase n=1 Tax=Fodinicurvata sp. EGI_FJ10296 TaxID=3231908 RepID=UPI0034572979